MGAVSSSLLRKKGVLFVALNEIKRFVSTANGNPELAAKLKECLKVRELLALGKEYGFELDEVELYPPNEPQFTEAQLSPKLAKALLRA
jgi:predicted ribosomally synthesized peptide with nif11-like leader